VSFSNGRKLANATCCGANEIEIVAKTLRWNR